MTRNDRHLLSLSQEIPPIMLRNLTWTIPPRLQVPTLFLIDICQLIRFRAENVCRSENMRRMIVKPQVVVNDAMVDMVRLEQMLQRPRSLLGSLFDIMDFGLGDVDAALEEIAERGELRESELEHIRKYRFVER